MTKHPHALLIDMDGVLYQGEQAIPGAARTLDWIRDASLPHLFLTNTTSRPRSALVEKLAGLGIATEPERILTPSLAARRWLQAHVPGPVALFLPAATREEFDDLEQVAPDSAETAAAVVIGDLGTGWTYPLLNQAFRRLMADPPPLLLALGMTRYWRAGDGLRLDTGPFVAALEFAANRRAMVLGKPAAPFFETALEQLGVIPQQACMIGDDIRGDVDAAQQAGIPGLLVRTGKFRPSDLDSGIRPAGLLDSIADLPEWWERRRLAPAPSA